MTTLLKQGCVTSLTQENNNTVCSEIIGSVSFDILTKIPEISPQGMSLYKKYVSSRSRRKV